MQGSVFILIAVLGGVLIGLSQEAAMSPVALLGIALCQFMLLSLLSAIVLIFDKDWTSILWRTLGSWIAASGLLLGGWVLSGKLPPL
ncbi:hypothetical protein LCGC14_0115620 [marine sediment metagenome]|uniref:Uncharacterized protein n=1 Tax=marine sediment metagenome TaxID=412755 RepID=A0A0F9VP94_9ZZZZ